MINGSAQGRGVLRRADEMGLTKPAAASSSVVVQHSTEHSSHMEPSFIFHIITKSDYEHSQAAGEWGAPSLATVRRFTLMILLPVELAIHFLTVVSFNAIGGFHSL